MAVNYAMELEQIVKQKAEKGKKLLLHSCCAPCSSYVLEYLRSFFKITVFYYNPNISQQDEYLKREEEQKKLITILNSQKKGNNIQVMTGDYDIEEYYSVIQGLEQCKEGGARCAVCFELRLCETVKQAAKLGFDYFTTTLTISPLKNARTINEIGRKLELEYGVNFLPSDFKKKDGYKKSIQLSHEYGLYRQNYCGCIFSKQEREKQKQEQWQRQERVQNEKVFGFNLKRDEAGI